MTEIAKSTGTKGMAGLALPFYETPLELTAGMACGRLDQLVKYPSAVVVLVSTSLDAYINETLAYLHFLELEPTKKRQIAELQKNKELREKWVGAPEVLAGTALDKQAEPYLSFDLMLRLRNKLVHYSAAFRTPSEYPLAAIDEYKQRFSFTYEGSANWTSQLLNLECARWSCRTAREMVHAFHKLSGIAQLYDWSDPA